MRRKIKRRVKAKLGYYIARLKLAYLVKKSGVDKNTWIFFLAPCSTGDVLFLCSLMASFKLKNGGKVAVIVRKNHASIVEMFCDVDFCISLNSISFECYEYTKISKSSIIKKGQLFMPHVVNESFSDSLLVLGYKNFNVVDVFKMMLRLDMNSKISQPDFRFCNAEKAKKFLADNDFNPNKTVILFPTAFTCHQINSDFWKNTIQSLTSLGFNILVNYLGDNDDFVFNQKNIVRINQSLDDVVALSLLCAGIISLRSGICDLLCFTDKKIVALYPDDKSYKDFNLKNIFEQRSNLLEIVLDKNCDQGLAEKEVLSFFS